MKFRERGGAGGEEERERAVAMETSTTFPYQSPPDAQSASQTPIKTDNHAVNIRIQNRPVPFLTGQLYFDSINCGMLLFDKQILHDTAQLRNGYSKRQNT